MAMSIFLDLPKVFDTLNHDIFIKISVLRHAFRSLQLIWKLFDQGT